MLFASPCDSPRYRYRRWALAALFAFCLACRGFAQELQIAPDSRTPIVFTGPEGGSFAAASDSFWTLTSSTGDPIEFSVSSDQLWLTLTPSDGAVDRPVLDPVAEVEPRLTIEADDLAPGIYTANVTFQNFTLGNTVVRTVRLEVAPASFTITPSFLNVVADEDSAPDAVTVTLTNSGQSDLNYTVSVPSRSWLSASTLSGTVPGAGQTSFDVLLNAFGLEPATYSANIAVNNRTTGAGSREIPVSLIVQPSAFGAITINPSSDLIVDGPAGSIPSGSRDYVLINDSDESISWTAEASENWITISPAAGSLWASDGHSDGFDEQEVEVRVNAARQDLAAGSHNATVQFNRIFISPLTGSISTLPVGSILVRSVADPVLSVSIPTQGGHVEIAPVGNIVAGGTSEDMTLDFGDVVTLTAVVETGYEFQEWVADFRLDTPEANPLVVTMDESRSLTAVITPIMRTLTLSTSGVGTGTATASPAPLATENALVSQYANGTSITLTATPDNGSVFTGWDGNIPAGAELDNPLVVNLDRDRTITARFDIGVELVVEIDGDGDVEVDPDQAYFHVGDSVTLTATPADGSEFAGWSGAFTGTDPEITLVLSEDASIVATFVEEGDGGFNNGNNSGSDLAKLTVDVQGDGVVTPPGGNYNIGASLTLIATPGVGSRFVRWENGASGTALTTVVTMDTDRTVLAIFEPLDDSAGQSIPGGSTQMCGAVGMVGLSLLMFAALGMLVPPRLRRMRQYSSRF